jgi:hypothetical protein
MHTALDESRAAGVQRVVATIPSETLLARVAWPTRIGQTAYWPQIAVGAAAILAAAHIELQAFVRQPFQALRRIFGFIGTVLTDPVDTTIRLATELYHEPALMVALGGFALAGVMAHMANRRMSETFSQFWYAKQDSLRAELKGARRQCLRTNALDARKFLSDEIAGRRDNRNLGTELLRERRSGNRVHAWLGHGEAGRVLFVFGLLTFRRPRPLL